MEMKRIEMGMGRKIVITLALVMAMWGLMLPKMVSMVKALQP